MNKLYFLNKDFFQSECGLKYVLSCFFNFYLVIQLFDVSRNALALPGLVHVFLALVRDAALFSVLLYLIIMRKNKITSYIFPASIFSLCLPVFITIGEIMDETKIVPLADVVQLTFLCLRPFVFLFILCNLDAFYVFNKQNIMKTFIATLVVMVVFSFVVYFFFPSLISKFDIENRIGLGNMSVQSGMYLCAYILCVHFFPFKSETVNWVCLITLLVGIVLSVCSTGILCTLMVTIIFMFERGTRKTSLIVMLLCSLVVSFVIIKYYSLLKPFMEYFEGKAEDVIDLILNVFTGNYDAKSIKSSSFNARSMEIQNMLKYNNEPIDYLFGHGYFSICIPEEMVENGYYEIYFSCGLFGIIVLAAMYLKYGLKSLRLFFWEHKVVGICAFFSLVLFMVTLCVIVLPTLSLSFIVLFYILFYQNLDKKGEA